MSDEPVQRRYCLGVSSIPPVEERDDDHPDEVTDDVPTDE